MSGAPSSWHMQEITDGAAGHACWMNSSEPSLLALPPGAGAAWAATGAGATRPRPDAVGMGVMAILAMGAGAGAIIICPVREASMGAREPAK